jgi:hypothetical protein
MRTQDQLPLRPSQHADPRREVGRSGKRRGPLTSAPPSQGGNEVRGPVVCPKADHLPVVPSHPVSCRRILRSPANWPFGANLPFPTCSHGQETGESLVNDSPVQRRALYPPFGTCKHPLLFSTALGLRGILGARLLPGGTGQTQKAKSSAVAGHSASRAGAFPFPPPKQKGRRIAPPALCIFPVRLP